MMVNPAGIGKMDQRPPVAAVGELPCQACDRGMQCGMQYISRDLGEGLENEAAYVQAWVRQCHSLVMKHEFIVKKQIDVDDPRLPASCRGSARAEARGSGFVRMSARADP